MNIKEYMKNNVLVLDGAMGTMLHKAGLGTDELPEGWNISHPEEIIAIHKAYYDAGSNVVSTNTFGANLLKFTADELREVIIAAVENCRRAKALSSSSKEKFIAFDMGPLGKLLKPYGTLDFEDAVSIFAESVKIAVECGVDLIFIETMNDSYETKAAVLAAKENSDLPVFVSNAYSLDGKLLTGATPAVMACMLDAMGVDAIGANCSFGPSQTLEVLKELSECTALPVIMKPNAGLPQFENGITFYNVSPEEFANEFDSAFECGISVVGGCCGTSPEYIRCLCERLGDIKPVIRTATKKTCVSSYSQVVQLGASPVLIGERINPTGKKRFKQALIDNDIDYILSEATSQQDKGVHILDVNVGLAGINEKEMLKNIVAAVQAVCDLPLQIDSCDSAALEAAMRIYNGKPLVNSVNGKKESMDTVFPLVKKYGGSVIALTLDENGIPDTADGRIAIADKIIREASSYGIDACDIIFDPLTMTVSTDAQSALKTIECVERLNKMGYRTSLGVSNISFGLPDREMLNSTFFSMALTKGLDAAIMNPYSAAMMNVYYSFCALSGKDEAFSQYISYVDSGAVVKATATENSTDDNLCEMIQKGRCEAAARLTEKMLSESRAFDIINGFIIPALDECGRRFESGKIFLPQLLMCAEAASQAFVVIKSHSSGTKSDKATVIIATVKGDIHDIGKNIVRLLLENYGFNVIDLGKDVDISTIVERVMETDAPLLGLSALMTTTLPSMEETVNAVKSVKPDCRIFVGGAVVTEEFAKKINADKYARDAMEAVRYCEGFND